jgi:hypothetical protein
VTVGARAERRVERERPRLQLFERQVVVHAREVLGEYPLAVRVGVRQIDEVERHESAGQAQCGLHRVGQPLLCRALHRQPVDDHLDGVLLLLVELGRLGQQVDVPVGPRPGEPLGLELAVEVDVLPLAPAHDRSEHLEARALLELEHAVDDLLRGLPGDRAPTDGAVRSPGPGVEEPQVVVDLGDGADRRPGVLRGRLLVDGDGGRQALDEVDVGLVHLPEELPGVRRQRLDIPALALGEDRVERQAGLARARQAREHDHGVPREVQRDVLEVVLAGSADQQLVGHRSSFWLQAVVMSYTVMSYTVRSYKVATVAMIPRPTDRVGRPPAPAPGPGGSNIRSRSYPPGKAPAVPRPGALRKPPRTSPGWGRAR